MGCSPYIVYVDETGDRGLHNINPTAPVFVLCAAIYRIEDYLGHEQQALGRLKFRLWWHDNVVLHSRKIRRNEAPFEALADPVNRDRFYKEISAFFKASKAKFVAAGIEKQRHKEQYFTPLDPYFLATQFVLERVYGHVFRAKGDTTFIFEARGDEEDKRLAEVFHRICEPNGNLMGQELPFRIQFASKKTNLAGLQVADLAAYPISRYVMDEKTTRPDWELVKPLIRTSPSGKMLGWGLKVFPEKPTEGKATPKKQTGT